MAKKIINVRTNQKTDTTAGWNSANPILQKGEIGIEICTNGSLLIKIGDGTKRWKELKAANGGYLVKWTD